MQLVHFNRSAVRFYSIASPTALMTEILFNWKWMVYCISVSARVCARSAVSACSKKEFHTLTHSVVLFATCIISHTSTKSGIKKNETIKCIRRGCVRSHVCTFYIVYVHTTYSACTHTFTVVSLNYFPT